jgi:hypothetical protein
MAVNPNSNLVNTSSFPRNAEISNIPGPAPTPVTHKRYGNNTAPIPTCFASKKDLNAFSISAADISLIPETMVFHSEMYPVV